MKTIIFLLLICSTLVAINAEPEINPGNTENLHLPSNSEPQGTPISEVQGTPISEVHGTPISEVHGTPISEVQGTPVQGTPISEIQGTPVHGTPISEVQGSPNAEVQGTPISEVQGTPISEVQGSPNAEVQGTPISEVQGTPITSLPPLHPPIRGKTIERVSYVDEHGIRHTKTIETTNTGDGKPTVVTTETTQNASEPQAPFPDPKLDGLLNIFKEMEQMLPFATPSSAPTIIIGRPRFRGRPLLVPVAPIPSSVVFEMGDGEKKQLHTANELGINSSDAQNPELTHPIVTVESADNVASSHDHDVYDDQLSSQQSKRETMAKDASRKSAGRSAGKLMLIIALGVAMAGVAIYFLWNSDVLKRKTHTWGSSLIEKNMHKIQTLTAQLADNRKRKD